MANVTGLLLIIERENSEPELVVINMTAARVLEILNAAPASMGEDATAEHNRENGGNPWSGDIQL